MTLFQTKEQCKELNIMPAVLKDWMFDPSSFMERLKKYGVIDAEIHVLHEAFTQPEESERIALALSDETVWVREVLISSKNSDWMFARTVIPHSTLTEEEAQLAHLGSHSLGSVLFKHPFLERRAFEFAYLKPKMSLHQKINTAMQKKFSNLWARRSIFLLKEKSLLLTEIFLPDIEVLGVTHDDRAN